MSLFQLALLIVAGVIFYLFFKQLFSGDYPKRGVDYEAKTSDEQIGGISRPDKIFSKPKPLPDRTEELLRMADEAIEKGDLLEARKAVESALIREPENIDALRRKGYLLLEDEAYEEAKEIYEKIVALNGNDDLAYDSLANTLHKLGKSDEAIALHQKAIALDGEYAPHYYNYANTLYDLGRYDEALELYKKALEIDPELSAAQEMIKTLSSKRG